MQPIKISLIGYGTIAKDVLSGLPQLGEQATQWAVLLRADSPSIRDVPEGIKVFTKVTELLQWSPCLVVETAGQSAVSTHVPDLLRAGVSVVVTSVGALADQPTYDAVRAAARTGGSRVIVPSGAVASLDYIGALSVEPQAQVTYESRKPPGAWRQELVDAGYDPDRLSDEVTLFEGNAQQAALRYPKNLNVAATIALAGLGMERTHVRVVVDPAAKGNQHRIDVRSPFGTLSTMQTNAPSPGNPKTSWIVAQSVIRSIERQFAEILIG